MSMQVEIYDERETQSDTLEREPDTEALALIEELGLQAQKHESGQRLTHPVPTAEQAFILDMLFPERTKLEDYDAGGIPLRVLKEIRSYRAEHPGVVLVVCHAPPVQVKDPVLLAYHGEYQWMATHLLGKVSGKMTHRMVARWGDALESWEALSTRAQQAAADIVETMGKKLARLAADIRDGHRVSEIPEITQRSGTPF